MKKIEKNVVKDVVKTTNVNGVENGIENGNVISIRTNGYDALLIEKDNNGGQLARESLILEPKYLSVLSNELAMKIVNELAKEPACAMDLAKKFKMNAQHGEQKIYYHMRKLEKSGIITQVSSANRYGMVAKIYDVVAPVVATKLFESNGRMLPEGLRRGLINPEVKDFLKPFITNGKLNAKIIVGSSYPHGRFEATARNTYETIALGFFLGKFLGDDGTSFNYKNDTQITEDDLKENLILIGSSKVNSIVDKITAQMPIYFNEEKSFSIVSRLSGKVYNYDNDALVVRMKNPFNKKKEILVLASKRSVGLRSALLALVRHTEKIMEGNSNDKNVIARVVQGLDKDSDGVIDAVKFLE